MILMGTWLTSQMADSIPKDFEIGLFAFPRLPQGQGEQTGLFGAANLLSVNATSDYPT
jgi:raffinose/stachyose/melibiose transport system substrate-binding protein